MDTSNLKNPFICQVFLNFAGIGQMLIHNLPLLTCSMKLFLEETILMNPCNMRWRIY